MARRQRVAPCCVATSLRSVYVNRIIMLFRSIDRRSLGTARLRSAAAGGRVTFAQDAADGCPAGSGADLWCWQSRPPVLHQYACQTDAPPVLRPALPACLSQQRRAGRLSDVSWTYCAAAASTVTPTGQQAHRQESDSVQTHRTLFNIHRQESGRSNSVGRPGSPTAPPSCCWTVVVQRAAGLHASMETF